MKFSSSSDYKVLFLGYLYPKELESKIFKQDILPIQTQRFGTALLNSLDVGFDGNVDVLSVAPLLDFPHSRLLIGPIAKWKIDNHISATMVPFINLIGVKHFTRFISTFFFVSRWIFINRHSSRLIVMHGVQSCKIWGALLGQIIKPNTTVSFLTDDLGVQPLWENNSLRRLRKIDIKLMKLGLQRVNGVISMTEKLADKLAPGRPKLIIPTIQNIDRTPMPNNINDSGEKTFNIVYTGGLTHDYGINLLVTAFLNANHSNWRLIISGWGYMENQIRDVSSKNPHVQFLGLLDHEELSNLFRRADVLVNPKLSSTSFAEMSFPSKIVEYLGTGKPVISTNLPVFDEEFRKHLVIAKSDTAEELLKCFYEVYSWNQDKLNYLRDENLRYLREKLSPNAQGAKIKDFILKIC